MRQKSGPEKQPEEDAIKAIRRATRRHLYRRKTRSASCRKDRAARTASPSSAGARASSRTFIVAGRRTFSMRGRKRLAGDTAREAESWLAHLRFEHYPDFVYPQPILWTEKSWQSLDAAAAGFLGLVSQMRFYAQSGQSPEHSPLAAEGLRQPREQRTISNGILARLWPDLRRRQTGG